MTATAMGKAMEIQTRAVATAMVLGLQLTHLVGVRNPYQFHHLPNGTTVCVLHVSRLYREDFCMHAFKRCFGKAAALVCNSLLAKCAGHMLNKS